MGPLRALVAAVVALHLAGCGPQGPEREGDPSLDARIRVSPTPAVVGPAGVSVRVSDDGAPLVGAGVQLLAIGPAGDSIGPFSASPQGDGYGPVTMRVTRPGTWWVEVSVTAPDGRHSTVRHPLEVVAAPPR